MQIVEKFDSGVLLLEPRIFRDNRGHFFESYNRSELSSFGIEECFVQDNESHSCRNVLRGLHYQIRHAQGKLVRVTNGEIFDVAVDLRKYSPNFGRWHATRLSSENKWVLWIPPGFAHGFLVLSEYADVLYKTTQIYAPEYERTVLWNDPDLRIDWPLEGEPILSMKDATAARLADAEIYLSEPSPALIS